MVDNRDEADKLIDELTVGNLPEEIVRYGGGRMRLARKHWGTLVIGTLIPPVFTLGLLGLPMSNNLSSRAGQVYYACYLQYASAVIASATVVAARHGFAYLFLLPPIFLTNHLGLGWGFLLELLTGGKRQIGSESKP